MLTRRNLMILLPAAAAGTAYTYWSRNNSTGGVPAFDISANAQETLVEVPEMTLGDPDAPVKVIEYASLTCSHCASFHTGTFKDFKRDYIDTGKVYFTHREVFFDRYGLWAAMMARCGGTDRYFGLIDQLYRTQGEWSRGADPATVVASIKKIGLQAGLDSETLDACMQDGDMAQSLVANYQTNTTADNVKATPSFLINGTLHSGDMSLSEIGALVDAAM
jgi:protein-disulfide isomerase